MAFAAGYLVGSVPLGLIVAWATAGIDIRRYGTGNIGAANIRRNVGLFPAAVVALGIFLQGLSPALVVHLLGGSKAAVGGAAIGAVVDFVGAGGKCFRASSQEVGYDPYTISARRP